MKGFKVLRERHTTGEMHFPLLVFTLSSLAEAALRSGSLRKWYENGMPSSLNSSEVLSTPAVFQRPWCAGEITCAYSSRIPVFLVNFVGGQEEEEANPSRLKVNEMHSSTYALAGSSRLFRVKGFYIQRRLRDFPVTQWRALSLSRVSYSVHAHGGRVIFSTPRFCERL